jgi:hypothetical protein
LLLPPVNKFPWFAKLTRAAHLYFHENQYFFLKGNDIQFAHTVAVTPCKDVKAQS